MQSGLDLRNGSVNWRNGHDPRWGYITFSEDEPVHYGGDTSSGMPDVDDQRRTLPCGKTERGLHRSSAIHNKKKRVQTNAFRTPVFAM